MTDQSVEGGYVAAERLVRLPAPPGAIVAFNDSQAFGVLKALTTLGQRVPDDLAIVGADDLPGSDLLPVPLTTVVQSGAAIGERATTLLLSRIERGGRDHPRLIVILPRLIVRDIVLCTPRRPGPPTRRRRDDSCTISLLPQRYARQDGAGSAAWRQQDAKLNEADVQPHLLPSPSTRPLPISWASR